MRFADGSLCPVPDTPRAVLLPCVFVPATLATPPSVPQGRCYGHHRDIRPDRLVSPEEAPVSNNPC